MKYAFAAAALVATVAAAPGWAPEGYGAPAYSPESTTCTEEQTWSTSAPSAPEYTKPSEQTWTSSSVWAPASYSSTWVESSSAAATPTPYMSSSSTWVATSSKAMSTSVVAPVYSSTYVETTSTMVAPAPYKTSSSSSSMKPVGTAPGPKSSGVASPTGAKSSGVAAPSGTIMPSGSGVGSAPSPTGSPISPYKGSANALNAAGLLAGVGAVVALFL